MLQSSNPQLFAISLPWPLITKPRESAGTQYFRISRNFEELKKHIEETIGKTDIFGNPIREVLLEEYLSGREFAINGVARAGVRYVTDIWEYHKKLSPAGSMIYDRDVLMDSRGIVAEILTPYVMSVLEALGIRNGAFHAEVKWDETGTRGPLLLEVAARPMGSFQPRVVKLATGSNQIELLIDAFLDSNAFLDRTDRPYRVLQNATVIELMSHQRGYVTAFPLLDLLNPDRLLSYSSHRVGLKVGDWTEVTEDLLAGHPGTVFLLHNDINQIERDYRRIREREKNGGIVVSPNRIAHASKTFGARCGAFLKRVVKVIGF